jgi:hypothetical protein
MMNCKFLKIIGIGFILSVSTLANATLIDNGDYSTDTESGLDWLDWTETNKNMTQIEAVSQFSGAGWRAATGDEASGLMENYFKDFLGFGDVTYQGSNPGLTQLKMTFAQLLGVTNTWGNDKNTYALAGLNLYGVDDNSIISGTPSGTTRGSWVGIALTRATAIPEPTVITLFTLGLAGIGFARRRRF